ncbi:hypothetical protein [Spiroplasma endosymbiont of Crioceris asparagi]|uniref:hypothetical protein n=1 Tax=Spiroplasma endosymbiont of Crioceris asparagi TaxID=3066286 RepID=UPI0030D01CCF
MTVFKKFKLFFKKPNKISEYERLEKERIPNHDAFDDDPLLNIEPILVGSPEEKQRAQQNKKIIEKVKSTPTLDEKIQFKKVNESSPLSGIIQNAKKTNEQNIEKVYQSSETQKKMALIEEIKKNGGEIPDYLFTDLSKSNSANSYRQKANQLNKSSYNSHDIHEQLEKRRKLSEENQKRLKENPNGKLLNVLVNKNQNQKNNK